MSNPRYKPRSFAISPKKFGHEETIQWRTPDETWTLRERARLSASELQHQISHGVLELYAPTSDTPKMAGLAEALDTPYDRFQKMLTGHAVMQLEDIGMLRTLVGPRLDFWMLRGSNGEFVRAVERDAQRRKEAGGSATQRPAHASTGRTAPPPQRPFMRG